MTELIIGILAALAGVFYGGWQRSKRKGAEKELEASKELSRQALMANRVLQRDYDKENEIRNALNNPDDLREYFK